MQYPTKPTEKKYLEKWLNICTFIAVRQAEFEILLCQLQKTDNNHVAAKSKIFRNRVVELVRQASGEGMSGNFVPGFELQISSTEAGEYITGMFQLESGNSDRITIAVPLSIAIV